MNIIKKNPKLFYSLLILVLLLLFYKAYQFFFTPLTIKSITPPNKSFDISINTPVSIIFNRNVKNDEVLININPNTPHAIKINNNELLINFNTFLKYKTLYSISVLENNSKSNILTSFFTTVSPQGSSETSQVLEKELNNYYPLSPFVPPDNASFYFVYTGQLKMDVFLKGNKEVSQKEFEEWSKTKGVDTKTHQIRYLTPP